MKQQNTFSAFGLSPMLLQGLETLKFETPSPIQEQTIPWLLQGRDVIGQAQTGTGKTAAFGLPILNRINLDLLHPQALIIAPTRELAIQVAEHIEEMGAYLKKLRVVVLCGGQEYRPQLKTLKEGAHIVVGTPGRVLDHMDRGSLKLTHLITFVLDEADEMLRMGFIEEVEKILFQLPETKQIALFSATMPSRIRQIATKFLVDPVSVQIQTETATVKQIEQRFIIAQQRDKRLALLRILAAETYQGVIIFTRTKSGAEEVAEFLQADGYRAMAIHGDLTQPLRERVIMQFRQGAIDMLVATDVAARGLDVERVTHVINYDMPHDCETYVHRIGRTGRAGRSGLTILFVTPKEGRSLSMIERHTRQRIEKMDIPHDHAILLAKQARFMNNITERLTNENIFSYKRIVEHFLRENEALSAIDIAAALALFAHQDRPWTVSLPKVTAVEPKAKLSLDKKSSKKPSNVAEFGRKFAHNQAAQVQYRIDVGRIHGVKPANIVGAIANESGLEGRQITGLKICEDHSIVSLPKNMTKEIVMGLHKTRVCGRQLKLQLLNVA